MNNKIIHITKRIINRSRKTRESYIKLMKSLAKNGVSRSGLSCGNLAHAIAKIVIYLKRFAISCRGQRLQFVWRPKS